MPQLENALRQCAAGLLEQFTIEFADSDTAALAIRKLKRILGPRRPGWPRTAAVNIALQIRQERRAKGEGLRHWRPIYEKCLEGWPEIPERSHQELSLRRAVKKIEKRIDHREAREGETLNARSNARGQIRTEFVRSH